ncbi:MAG: hypothetical protein JSU94_17730 [Phycisphaerales bacterium]|nr:MAG: hypothetical protein JSU94_17730 [Phycisphaerales bacterium]
MCIKLMVRPPFSEGASNLLEVRGGVCGVCRPGDCPGGGDVGRARGRWRRFSWARGRCGFGGVPVSASKKLGKNTEPQGLKRPTEYIGACGVGRGGLGDGDGKGLLSAGSAEPAVSVAEAESGENMLEYRTFLV